MNQQGQFSQNRLIDFMAVIDIDPALQLFKPTQQKWISSLQLLSDIPKEIRSNSKHLTICPGLHMVIYFCQKNRLPIYEIDFIYQPGPDWISLKMPHNFMDKFGDYYLCYKTQQLQLAGALGDIDVLNTQKKSHLGLDKQVVNVPNGYKVLSSPISHNYLIYRRVKSRLEQTFKPIITERYPQNNKFNVGLLPSFCFPQGIKLYKQLKGFITFSFILTQQTGQRLYITYLTFKELLQQVLKNKLNVKFIQKIYYDKGFCIVSKSKFSDQLSECLQHLYRLSMSRNDLPFYKVAQNFVDELKLPKQIKTYGFSYSYSGCNITFQSDQTLDKTSQKSIYCIFKFLPVSAILTIFQAILLQKHVLFVSQSKTILGYAIQAFTSLLFPFKWQNPIIPIVPVTLKQLLNAPVPIIAAILPSLLDSSIQSETLIVQLDTGELLNDEDLPPLPQKLQKQLRKRLEQFQIYDEDEVRQYLQNPQNTYIFKMQQIQNPNFKGSIIRDIFFEFFLTLMKNYKKFWKQNKFKQVKETSSANYTQPQLINDIFRVQDFLSDLGMAKVGSFGYKFSQGTIFIAFLQRRYQNSDDHIGNFFDQCLERKKVKKDAILINPIQKIRYLVAKHPQPQNLKAFYSYDFFPSILSQKKVDQSDIQIKLDVETQPFQKDQRIIMEFIQDQRQVQSNFFEPILQGSVKDQKDLVILGLLTNKNKQIYLQKKKQQNCKNCYVLFREVYELQMNQIQVFMSNWPKPRHNGQNKFIAIEKQEYLKLIIQKKLQKQEKTIIGICEDQNYQMLIKGQLKISITSSTSMISEEQMRLSSNCLKKFSICIQDYRIRRFMNRNISLYSSQIFEFILQRAKTGYDSQWNIQTLIDLREFIQNRNYK